MQNQGYIHNYIHVCVDEKSSGEIAGRVYHAAVHGVRTFTGVDELVTHMDGLCDRADFPEASTQRRAFKKAAHQADTIDIGENEGVTDMDNEQRGQGKKATFVVQIQYRQNATWQGTVNWVEQNEEKPFRSALELIRMIDQATEESEI